MAPTYATLTVGYLTEILNYRISEQFDSNIADNIRSKSKKIPKWLFHHYEGKPHAYRTILYIVKRPGLWHTVYNGRESNEYFLSRYIVFVLITMEILYLLIFNTNW